MVGGLGRQAAASSSPTNEAKSAAILSPSKSRHSPARESENERERVRDRENKRERMRERQREIERERK